MAEKRRATPPPRWFIHVAWWGHRALVRVTGRRRGLWRAEPGKWGTIRLTTVGRRSGKVRQAILAYVPDGPNLVTMAMNGWGEGPPAWWLNLQTRPVATVEILEEDRTVHELTVRAREAVGAERERLWRLYRDIDDHLDELAARRSTATPVVVLERVG